MSKPVIAAIDPRREDVGPVALGVLLARVIEVPPCPLPVVPLAERTADQIGVAWRRAAAAGS
jgi:hypothetical protein